MAPSPAASGAPEGVHDPARHQAPEGAPWSDTSAEHAIRTILDDFAGARREDGSWPTHPDDHDESLRLSTAYAGAAGAVSALGILRAEGLPAEDFSATLPAIHRAFLERPDFGPEPGLQLGEVGILTPAVAADKDDSALRSKLVDALERTIGHPAREITKGATGALHASWTLFEQTGDERWADLYLRAADSLFETWQPQPDLRAGDRPVWLWRHEIFGSTRRYFGACHGVAGNAQALLRGARVLGAERVEQTLERTRDALAAGALVDGDDLNWPVSPDPSGTRRLVQWCHGAAGVVAALGGPFEGVTRDPELDALVLRAAEFVWRAGPPRKGPGLCHGSAGSGYGFLALHRRTGEARWLERARVFAMHGIEQRDQARRRLGRGRYTLWNGDGGLAVFLQHCRTPERARFPGLEVF